MADNQQFVQTPIGTAGYCYINRPDEKYGDKYKVRIAMDKKTAEPLLKKMQEFVEDNFAPKDRKELKLPYKEEDGLLVFEFKSKYQPKVFDAKGDLIPAKDIPFVGKGSKIRAKSGLAPYKSATSGTGVTTRLSSVQIVELHEGGSSGGGFDAVDGGFTFDNNKSAQSTEWSDDEAEALDI